MSSRIQLSGVRQTFLVRGNDDRKLREFVALDDLSIDIRAGEFLTVVGPSGCGKSTVLDLVAGLTRPTSGTVSVDGRVITGPGLDRSVVFQQYTLLPWRTAQANIEFALEAAGRRAGRRKERLSKAQRVERARTYLELVGLTDFANRYPHELSGGMKQRVAIARSLSYQPEVLLMDEPFGALDAQTRERLQEELVAIWERTGTTVVFITHDIDEAVFLGQRVAVMSARPGRIQEVIDVDLDRRTAGDRDLRATPEFAAYRHRIWTLLREQQVAASAEELITKEVAHVA
jgi:NitT/TauT family transport system ATP-binding protein